eukprot:scaffold37377_cov61-Phaeocystis_antarctica.AAC.1
MYAQDESCSPLSAFSFSSGSPFASRVLEGRAPDVPSHAPNVPPHAPNVPPRAPSMTRRAPGVPPRATSVPQSSEAQQAAIDMAPGAWSSLGSTTEQLEAAETALAVRDAELVTERAARVAAEQVAAESTESAVDAAADKGAVLVELVKAAEVRAAEAKYMTEKARAAAEMAEAAAAKGAEETAALGAISMENVATEITAAETIAKPQPAPTPSKVAEGAKRLEALREKQDELKRQLRDAAQEASLARSRMASLAKARLSASQSLGARRPRSTSNVQEVRTVRFGTRRPSKGWESAMQEVRAQIVLSYLVRAGRTATKAATELKEVAEGIRKLKECGRPCNLRTTRASCTYPLLTARRWRALLLPPMSLIAANKRDCLPDACFYRRGAPRAPPGSKRQSDKRASCTYPLLTYASTLTCRFFF